MHILHNAFQRGFDSTGWDIKSFLSSLYILFHDTPARRDDYMEIITKSNIFPLKFCATRWVENAKVANRALTILDNLKKYVETILNKESSKKYTIPKTKSFDIIKDNLSDPLLPAKLLFFEMIANEYEEFLATFQTDKPMSMFLHRDLEKLLRNQMKRFVKKEVLDENSSASQMVLLKVDSSVQVTYGKVDVGFAATLRIKELVSTKKVSERDAMDFKMKSKQCLATAVAKIQEKCPLKYSMTRNLSCLDPVCLAKDRKDCATRFKRILNKLVDLNQIRENQCDRIQREYETFLDDTVAKNASCFLDYDYSEERIDMFLGKYLNGDKKFSNLWIVARKCLIVSHGQAAVERGFSINNQVIVENLVEESLIAQRQVYDAIHTSGGLLKVPITRSMLTYAEGARQMYYAYLDEMKAKKKPESQLDDFNSKRKLDNEKLIHLKAKKQRLVTDITALKESSDNLADKAEETGDLSLLTKANSFRRSVKQKEEEMSKVDKDISSLTSRSN